MWRPENVKCIIVFTATIHLLLGQAPVASTQHLTNLLLSMKPRHVSEWEQACRYLCYRRVVLWWYIKLSDSGHQFHAPLLLFNMYFKNVKTPFIWTVHATGTHHHSLKVESYEPKPLNGWFPSQWNHWEPKLYPKAGLDIIKEFVAFNWNARNTH